MTPRRGIWTVRIRSSIWVLLAFFFFFHIIMYIEHSPYVMHWDQWMRWLRPCYPRPCPIAPWAEGINIMDTPIIHLEHHQCQRANQLRRSIQSFYVVRKRWSPEGCGFPKAINITLWYQNQSKKLMSWPSSDATDSNYDDDDSNSKETQRLRKLTCIKSHS